MTAKTDAWMPLWIGDYLADTQHLTRDEHGAYLLLLMAYWRNGGPLVDDDKRLAAIVKASAREWAELRPVMLEFFHVTDGAWSQKRMDAELIGSADRANKKAAKAAAGGTTRWGSDSDRSGRALRSQRLAEARQKGTHSALEWEAMKNYHGMRCCRCGADGEMVKDHIKPIYQGGSDGLENLQPLCRSCNASKGPEAIDHRKEGWREAIDAFRNAFVEGNKRQPDAFPSPSPSSSLRSEDRSKRGSRKVPADWEPDASLRAFAKDKCPAVQLDAELAKFRDHQFSTPKTDWDGTLRNWLRRAQEQAAQRSINAGAGGKYAGANAAIYEGIGP